jgi:hypothetical protein
MKSQAAGLKDYQIFFGPAVDGNFGGENYKNQSKQQLLSHPSLVPAQHVNYYLLHLHLLLHVNPSPRQLSFVDTLLDPLWERCLIQAHPTADLSVLAIVTIFDKATVTTNGMTDNPTGSSSSNGMFARQQQQQQQQLRLQWTVSATSGVIPGEWVNNVKQPLSSGEMNHSSPPMMVPGGKPLIQADHEALGLS